MNPNEIVKVIVFETLLLTIKRVYFVLHFIVFKSEKKNYILHLSNFDYSSWSFRYKFDMSLSSFFKIGL